MFRGRELMPRLVVHPADPAIDLMRPQAPEIGRIARYYLLACVGLRAGQYRNEEISRTLTTAEREEAKRTLIDAGLANKAGSINAAGRVAASAIDGGYEDLGRALRAERGHDIW